MPEFKKMRTYQQYPPPHRQRLPLPELFDLQKRKAKQIVSPCYPAWNVMYYNCLASLQKGKFNRLVETGTNFGCSSALLAQAMREYGVDGHVFTFEIRPKVVERAKELWQQLGLAESITLTVGDSLKKIPEVIDDKPIQFAFIDGLHTREYVVRETELLLPNVVAGKGKFYYDNAGCGPVDEGLCDLKKTHSDAGWVDFPGIASEAPGQVMWQPWVKRKPDPYIDLEGNKCVPPED